MSVSSVFDSSLSSALSDNNSVAEVENVVVMLGRARVYMSSENLI